MDYDEFEEKNRELTNIFQHIGAEYGYKTVNAEYLAVKDFKVRWQRSYDWIDFRASDYLEDAPEEVLEGLARNLFDRIAGKGTEFSTALKEWVTRPEFCQQKQKIFLERSKYVLNTAEGEHKNRTIIVYFCAKPRQLEDPKNVLKDVSSVGHHGRGDLRFDLNDAKQIPVVCEFVNQVINL